MHIVIGYILDNSVIDSVTRYVLLGTLKSKLWLRRNRDQEVNQQVYEQHVLL